MNPTPSTYWKGFERRIARSLGVERAPLSGGGYTAGQHNTPPLDPSGKPLPNHLRQFTRSDTLHPTLYIEAKCRARHSIFTWWRACIGNAVIEHKTPLLALHEHGHKGALAVMEWKYFVHLYEADLELQQLRKETE